MCAGLICLSQRHKVTLKLHSSLNSSLTKSQQYAWPNLHLQTATLLGYAEKTQMVVKNLACVFRKDAKKQNKFSVWVRLRVEGLYSTLSLSRYLLNVILSAEKDWVHFI